MFQQVNHRANCIALRLRLCACICLGICLCLAMASDTHGGALRGGQPSEFPFQETNVLPGDDIWKVSTRGLPIGACKHCQSKDSEEPQGNQSLDLRYWRFDRESNDWLPSDKAAFIASRQDNQLTSVYVHGNRIDGDWTDHRGLTVYRLLRPDHKDADPRPLRFVIWSWPSDPLPRKLAVVRDARVKACRTPLQSYYLADWLAQQPASQQWSLIGYSFGSRVILGATHLVGGGELEGRSLPAGNDAERIKPRVALMATAAESNWLLPGGKYEQAAQQLSGGVVFYNRLDRVLRRYECLMPESSGPALGSSGLPPGIANRVDDLIQQDATCIVGRPHRFHYYARSASVSSHIRNAAFFQKMAARECHSSKAAVALAD